MYLSLFIKFSIKNNSFHEDVLMIIFSYSLNGKNAWVWYCDFIPKEINPFHVLLENSRIVGYMYMAMRNMKRIK
jgi:hypothetical protein